MTVEEVELLFLLLWNFEKPIVAAVVGPAAVAVVVLLIAAAAAVVVAAVVGPAAAAVVVMSELPISNILCLIFQVGIIGCPIAKHREYGVLA